MKLAKLWDLIAILSSCGHVEQVNLILPLHQKRPDCEICCHQVVSLKLSICRFSRCDLINFLSPHFKGPQYFTYLCIQLRGLITLTRRLCLWTTISELIISYSYGNEHFPIKKIAQSPNDSTPTLLSSFDSIYSTSTEKAKFFVKQFVVNSFLSYQVSSVHNHCYSPLETRNKIHG